MTEDNNSSSRHYLRRKYSELLSEIENEAYKGKGDMTIQNTCIEAGILCEKITHPYELKADTDLLATVSKITAKRAVLELNENKIENDPSTITWKFSTKYGEALRLDRNNDDADIANSFFYKIGSDFFSVFRYAEGYSGILGHFMMEQSKKKIRTATEKDDTAKVNKQVGKNKIENKKVTDTERRMIALNKAIHSHDEKGIPIAELILEVDSFSSTLANLFALSFLVKDRRVTMTMSDEGCIIKEYHTSDASKKNSSDATEPGSHQFIASFDKELYDALLDIVPKEKCIMHKNEFRIENNLKGDENLDVMDITSDN